MMIDFSDIPKYKKKEWEYDAKQISLENTDVKICLYLKSIQDVNALITLIIQYKSRLSAKDYAGLLRALNTVCENVIGQDLKNILNFPRDTKLYWGDEFSVFQQNEELELCKSH